MKDIIQLLVLLVNLVFSKDLKPPAPAAPAVPPDADPPIFVPKAPPKEVDGEPLDTMGEAVEIPSRAADAPQIVVPKFSSDPYPGPAGHIVRSLVEMGYGPVRLDGRLSVVAIRNSERDFDVFKCRIAHVAFREGEWKLLGSWPATTYPGHHYTVTKLLNKAGAAILTSGAHRNIYNLDSHRGIYEALCQRGGPVRVYRDGNRNRVYDLVPSTIQSGMFGINVHATQNPDGKPASLTASKVHAASAGCLVFARIGDFVDARVHWRTSDASGIRRPDLFLIESKVLKEPGQVDLSGAIPQRDDDEKAWFPEGFNTVGVRNRNLLNVKGDDKWTFSLGRDSKGHHIFPSFPKGLRAGIINLRSYWTRHNLTTIAAILSRWAPSSDTIGSIPGAPRNSPAAYSKFVAARMGIKPTDQLMAFHSDGSVRSADQLFLLVEAMVSYENDSNLRLPRPVFDQALALV